ncbi:hypothetical protein OG230_28120 [Streptomyces sp. NBC_00234]|uniref:hypothetical protein n=1 Tax=Streptomyces sp. NBC_00234 TaxID=2903638 RepID=UPI002E2E5463|nr:hypothetical protein [Streptomyces sp. NBC_00234]
MGMLNKCRPLVVLALLGSVATGCANGEPSPRDAQAKGTLRIDRSDAYYEGREIKLPLDEYALTKEQRRDYREAVYSLSSACMKGFGLSWPKPVEQESREGDNSRRYGVVDGRYTKKFGYGVPLPDGVTQAEALKLGRQNTDRTRALPQKTRDVYTGERVRNYAGKTVPKGGCRGEAYGKLGLPPQGMTSTTLDALRYESWDSARNHRIVLDAVVQWSACMSKAGYTYKTPEDAVADSAWQRQGEPSRAEIATSTADVRCKRDAMLVEKWHAIEVKNQERLTQEKADVLKGLGDQVNALAERIAQVRTEG